MSHQMEALLLITATAGREEEKKSGRRDGMVGGREEMGREEEGRREGERRSRGRCERGAGENSGGGRRYLCTLLVGL